jgi:putative protein-disulfide isomerase
MPTKLYYVHDPMCSWCWGFTTVWRSIQDQLPDSVSVQRVLGGLAPDSNDPMPTSMQLNLQQNWQRIQQVIPGTSFNYDFWSANSPRRSTYPACRAVIAAKAQGDEYELPMIQAIQEAYYLHAKNPSDDSTLIELSEAIACDVNRFEADLNSDQTQSDLASEIYFARRLGAQGFPSLFIESKSGGTLPVPFDYTDARVALSNISHSLAS